MHKQNGFNIVELVIVLVVLVVLGAISIPKIMDIAAETRAKTIKKLAVSLSSVNSENYKLYKKKSPKAVSIANCSDVAKLLNEALPIEYKISPAPVTLDKTVNCQLNGPGSKTQTFNATGVKAL